MIIQGRFSLGVRKPVFSFCKPFRLKNNLALLLKVQSQFEGNEF